MQRSNLQPRAGTWRSGTKLPSGFECADSAKKGVWLVVPRNGIGKPEFCGKIGISQIPRGIGRFWRAGTEFRFRNSGPIALERQPESTVSTKHAPYFTRCKYRSKDRARARGHDIIMSPKYLPGARQAIRAHAGMSSRWPRHCHRGSWGVVQMPSLCSTTTQRANGDIRARQRNSEALLHPLGFKSTLIAIDEIRTFSILISTYDQKDPPPAV